MQAEGCTLSRKAPNQAIQNLFGFYDLWFKQR